MDRKASPLSILIFDEKLGLKYEENTEIDQRESLGLVTRERGSKISRSKVSQIQIASTRLKSVLRVALKDATIAQCDFYRVLMSDAIRTCPCAYVLCI